MRSAWDCYRLDGLARWTGCVPLTTSSARVGSEWKKGLRCWCYRKSIVLRSSHCSCRRRYQRTCPVVLSPGGNFRSANVKTMVFEFVEGCKFLGTSVDCKARVCQWTFLNRSCRKSFFFLLRCCNTVEIFSSSQFNLVRNAASMGNFSWEARRTLYLELYVVIVRS